MNSLTTSKIPSFKAGGHSSSDFINILNKTSNELCKYFAAVSSVICSTNISKASHISNCTLKHFVSVNNLIKLGTIS